MRGTCITHFIGIRLFGKHFTASTIININKMQDRNAATFQSDRVV